MCLLLSPDFRYDESQPCRWYINCKSILSYHYGAEVGHQRTFTKAENQTVGLKRTGLINAINLIPKFFSPAETKFSQSKNGQNNERSSNKFCLHSFDLSIWLEDLHPLLPRRRRPTSRQRAYINSTVISILCKFLSVLSIRHSSSLLSSLSSLHCPSSVQPSKHQTQQQHQ